MVSSEIEGRDVRSVRASNLWWASVAPDDSLFIVDDVEVKRTEG